MSDIKNIAEKLEKMDSRLDNIDITLAKQNVSLEHHIKRTEINEQAIDILQNESNLRLKNLESWRDRFLGIAAFLGAVAGVITVLSQIGYIK